MVATKKSAAAAKPAGAGSVAETAPAKKAGGWAKGKTAAPVGAGAVDGAAVEQEFDPSRIAGVLNGGKPSAIPATAEENAQFEAGPSEIAAQQSRPSVQEAAGAAEAAGEKAAKPAKARAPAKTKTAAVEDAATTQQKATVMVEKKFADGVVDTNTSKELVSICEVVEGLMEEKADISTQISEKLGWAKGQGYNPVMIRKLLALRAQDPEKRRLMQAELETYANAAGIDL